MAVITGNFTLQNKSHHPQLPLKQFKDLLKGNIKSLVPCFGDHLLIHFEINIPKKEQKETVIRDWRRYSKDALCNSLSEIQWHLGVDGVQSYWNIIENSLIEVVDRLAPLVAFVDDKTKDSKHPKVVKNAINVKRS